jgi:DNA-binding XRE family transcriptional regulator
MGHDMQTVAAHLGITINTLKGIETGRFAWDIDLQHALCAALEIKPYFSVSQPPNDEDYSDRNKYDPERYHGFYITENLLLYPDQMAINKLTYPRLFIRFNYGDNYFSSYDDWKANHTELQWLDPSDKPDTEEEIDYILTDCWNFLTLHEREEERLADEIDDDFI